MNDIRFYKILVLANGLIPLLLLLTDAFRGNLGVNPIEFVLRTTGVLTLTLVLISLAITPLRKLFGWNSLIKYRRMLGLFAFFYACLHFITYFAFDRGLSVSGALIDIPKRPFIAVGIACFLMLIPLAATSTNGMIKRIGGKNWVRLHKLSYAVAIGGVAHFWMIVKSDIFYPALFGLVLAGLLLYRIDSARSAVKRG